MSNPVNDNLLNRKIIHIDMDAFFASVEQLDHPEYRGKPLIVGGTPEQRGVVSTASYEARKFGIHSAMPAKTARRLCPNGIFVEGNMRRYREVSHTIRGIFREVTDVIEPLSIDEAFLDVTINKLNEPSATRLAMFLQQKILQTTGLTASAGVSFNKFLAKIASDWRKPAGLTVITPARAEEFIFQLKIEKFYGVGEATARQFHKLNVKTGKDLYALPLETLVRCFGKMGIFYYNIVRGIDLRPVEPRESRKSLGREITLAQDLADIVALRKLLHQLAVKVSALLAKEKLSGRTITLKVRYEDFSTISRSMTVPESIAQASMLEKVGLMLLERTEAGKRKVRLMGLSVSGFPDGSAPEYIQLELPLEWENMVWVNQS
ncbi:MAG: DNA polymerase IV [Lentisphaerae bacterium]|nr:DNA polymerase IV [Lentisphaerota bacterium]